MQRSHTLPIVLTLGAACGSGPDGPKATPQGASAAAIGTAAAAPAPPVPPPPPLVAPLAVPDPPTLTCEDGASATPAPAPEPTWYCARADGTRHGAFFSLFPDGTIEREGRYTAGKLDGPWRRFHAGGALAEEGAFAAGLPTGTWRQLDPTSALAGEYTLKAGTGKQKRWLADGTLYSELSLRRGVPHGALRVFDREGRVVVYAGYYNGKLHGDHFVGAKNILRIEEAFVRGVRRGPRRIWQFWALIFEESYDEQGQLDGPFALWRDRRTPRVQGSYEHGKRVGTWVWTDRQGVKEREGDYVDGKKHGPWYEYEGGTMTFQGYYTDGKPDGEFIYYDRAGGELGRFAMTAGTGTMQTFHVNRRAATRTRMLDGARHGKYEELALRGRILVEGHHAYDRRHGWWREWSETGELVHEIHYKRGMLDGPFKKYEGGKLSVQATYRDGKAEGTYTELRDGRPSLVGQFSKGRRHGTWIAYGPDGVATLTASYKDGVLDGPWRQLSGGAVVEGELRAGRRVGEWIHADRAGTVTRTTVKAP